MPGTDDTRQRLLDAAQRLFSERGFDGVGIREIADAAGVNLSGIKYHFGSKQGLYLQTIRRSMDRQGSSAAWALIQRPFESPRDAADALRAFVRAFLRVLLRAEEAGSSVCLVMQSALHPGEATDLVAREFIAPNHQQLCALAAALRPDASPAQRDRAAQSVMALLLHQRLARPFLDRLHDGNNPSTDLDRDADEITDFALRGMGCPHLAEDTSPNATLRTAEEVRGTGEIA